MDLFGRKQKQARKAELEQARNEARYRLVYQHELARIQRERKLTEDEIIRKKIEQLDVDLQKMAMKYNIERANLEPDYIINEEQDLTDIYTK
jgi:hypothetical protein